jgi:multiple sugar transport system ATP-binding protein
MARIALQRIRKDFDDVQVIADLDLTIEDGEFMVFVGPSGCGKSTLLRMLSGLETTTAGDIFFDDLRVNDIAPADRGAAMVFQSYALYPHMTVAENMGFALRMSGRSKAQRLATVAEVADKLQLTDLLDRYPKQLSGGQRQRVAIGRAIVRRPKVFLFDEPLSNLDAALRVQMRIELARLHAELGTTMVYVTHDQTEAMTLGDRIAVFNKGRIEQIGRPMELYRNPANRFVAEFLGSPKINILPYRWDELHAQMEFQGGAVLPVPSSENAAQPWRTGAVVGWRPEDWCLAEAGSGLPGVVEFTENLGDVCVLYIRSPAATELLTVKLAGDQASAELGQKVGVQPAVEGLFFGADGRRVIG